MTRAVIRILLAAALTATLPGCGSERAMRSFQPVSHEQWIGNAVCYGPHRDGQRPGGASPSSDQVRADLHLMLPHWNLLRLYGSTGVAETILAVIREDNLDMKVMLGVWIAPEAAAANRQEVAAAIHLANQYQDIVIAVSVGNETQVSWSAHRSPMEELIGHVQTVRAGTMVPVTVADDFSFWKSPESTSLALELDFITVHAHPMWNGLQLEDALAWVQAEMAAVQKIHPDQTLVLGETGWATSVHDEGEQAELIRGRPGAAEQKFFYNAMRAWAEDSRMTVFFFEAFDEAWKGGSHPAEVEKHWGVFQTDRSPKEAVATPQATDGPPSF